MNIGKKIIEIRKKNNLSQEELAKMFFVKDRLYQVGNVEKVIPILKQLLKLVINLMFL